MEEKERIFVDAINILYVALTRAKRQLYILTKSKKDLLPVQTPKNVEDLFYNWLPHLEANKLPHTKTDDVDTKTYHFESEDLEWNYKPPVAKVESEFLKAGRLVEKPLRQGMIIAHQDLVEGDMYTLTDFIHSPQKRGVLMHQALQKIRYYEDIDLALRDLQGRGLLTTETRADLAGRLAKLLSSDPLKLYYDRAATSKFSMKKQFITTREIKLYVPPIVFFEREEGGYHRL